MSRLDVSVLDLIIKGEKMKKVTLLSGVPEFDPRYKVVFLFDKGSIKRPSRRTGKIG